MPDHLHMLIAVDGDTVLADLIRDFKRITAKTASIRWQRNFFDHRLRHDESENEKADYIRYNRVRAGLAEADEQWPYVIEGESMNQIDSPRSSRGRLRSIAPT